jgi:hypothetical protein
MINLGSLENKSIKFVNSPDYKKGLLSQLLEKYSFIFFLIKTKTPSTKLSKLLLFQSANLT